MPPKSDKYFARFNAREPMIWATPADDLMLVVTIPAYREENLMETLQSLNRCYQPSESIEMIIVFNAEVGDIEGQETNKRTAFKIKQWIKEGDIKFTFHILEIHDFTSKKSGVGSARKIAMDEASRRLPADGIITGLDADCTIAPNYFIAILEHFKKNPATEASAIYFEHDLMASDKRAMNAIIAYELHLRYFIEEQIKIGLPYAYQTVGSSMAVRNRCYRAVGGMNTRKAGEDFYFLQKCMKFGPFSDCTTTTVFPSGRISDRVPFGTGKAIKDILNNNGKIDYKTYHPQSFLVIRGLLEQIDKLYHGQELSISILLVDFLDQIQFYNHIKNIRNNTSSFRSFKKRFFHYFDGFLLMKTLHFLRQFYPDISVLKAVQVSSRQELSSLEEALKMYRNMAKTR